VKGPRFDSGLIQPVFHVFVVRVLVCTSYRNSPIPGFTSLLLGHPFCSDTLFAWTSYLTLPLDVCVPVVKGHTLGRVFGLKQGVLWLSHSLPETELR
jgi:hypothetical protein